MSTTFLKIAAVYLILAPILGLAMGIGQDFSLAPVHAHLALAGWVTLALTGLIYRAYPAAEKTALARAHFWLHNLGLPIFMVGLAGVLHGNLAMEKVAIIGSTVLLLGLIALAVNIMLKVKA